MMSQLGWLVAASALAIATHGAAAAGSEGSCDESALLQRLSPKRNLAVPFQDEPAVVQVPRGASQQANEQGGLTAWQGGRGKGGAFARHYDLAIVGAGIGGAYVVNKVREAPELAHQAIVMLERYWDIGGRLLMDHRSHASWAGPPIEYGGMRLDPQRHVNVSDMLQRVASYMYNLTAEQCNLTSCINGSACCPELLVPMFVSDIAYRMVGTKQNSNKLVQWNEKPLLPAVNVEEVCKYLLCIWDLGPDRCKSKESATPLVQALSIVPLVAGFFKTRKAPVPPSFGLAVDEACSQASSWNAGRGVVKQLEHVCKEFKNPAEMVMSVIGYDDDPYEDSLELVVGFVDEVVNLTGQSNFYLFRHGYQQFAKDILQSHGEGGVAPLYGKILTKIEVCGEGADYAEALAQKQIARFNSTTGKVSPADPAEAKCKKQPIRLFFEDNTSMSANSVYLTPLPDDLVKIGGLRAWNEPISDFMSTSMGTKLGLGWANFSLSELLNLTACWPGPCQRLILDGEDPWITRQVWLWTEGTALVYGNAISIADGGANQPSQVMDLIFKTKGLGEVVKTVMKELRLAANKTLQEFPDPDWADYKAWPEGSLVPDWVNLTTDGGYAFSGLLSRPFGPDVKVFYGNSEMAGNADHHTWVEGAFDAAEQVLPDLLEALRA